MLALKVNGDGSDCLAAVFVLACVLLDATHTHMRTSGFAANGFCLQAHTFGTFGLDAEVQ